MSKTYDSLTGALGKAAHYRPERLSLSEVMSEPTRASLLVRGEGVHVADVSLSGFSFWAKKAWDAGERVAFIFQVDGRDVIEGNWDGRAFDTRRSRVSGRRCLIKWRP